MKRGGSIQTSGESYEYIVVGSGAGGGPLAANLARAGYRVLLLEAGADPETYLYQVPCFHAYSTEEKAMAWNYFVHHYSKDEERDEKYCSDQRGVYYPRAGTLGGCTAHNAMITVVPHDSDWDHIAKLTGDRSWRASNMRQYFQRLERCAYMPQPGESGHGFSGWLTVSKVDPAEAIGDVQVVRTVIDAALESARGSCSRFFRRIFRFLETGDDPNDARNRAANEGVITTIPLATSGGRRNGTREFIRRVQKEHPDRLTVRMNHLATRVIFDNQQRAVGVECLEGQHLYRADPNWAAASAYEKRQYFCSHEVILAGGAFNTPQLLMLSGIGPKEHLNEKGILCRVDRPGVGRNLQDRYEVAVVSTMKRNFEMLSGATFKPPLEGEEGDPCFREWLKGAGIYTSSGAIAAVIMKSARARPDPDLFIFGLPGTFTGYYPGYSDDIERSKNYLTWAIVKAHTNNTNGTVRLKSNDPRETPDVNFHYFDESNDPDGQDLQSVVKAIEFVRNMNDRNEGIREEKVPGRHLEGKQLAKWITDNAWGHHASCSCRIGRADDPMAVVDSRFRVIGTKGLRVVDASVFPRIPGFFIVTPIYMVSEKAADTICLDRTSEEGSMAYDVQQLLKMSQADLDQLFTESPAGPIPDGEAEGTAIVDPGTVRAPEFAKLINHFAWQGKIFDAKNKTLVNHIGPFGMKAILAEVYIGKSLIDEKDCIVLDYSKTSFVAQHIRDEIRQIASNTYLGPVYWDTKKLFYFALHFKG